METHRIICGDSRFVLPSFKANSIDLVVTDPPYLCGYQDRDGRLVQNDDNPGAVLSVFDQVYRVLKPNRYCISFYGWNAIAGFADAWANAGFSCVGHIVWVKQYASGRGHTRRKHESAFILAKGRPRKPAQPIDDVLPWSYTGNKVHPTEKAVDVIEPLIKAYSQPGDRVLDPFLGSGTTAVSAVMNDRRAIGIELDAHYCDLARSRIDALPSG